jgi:hypothetical protein
MKTTREGPGVKVKMLRKCKRSTVSINKTGFMGVSVSIAILKAPSKKSLSGAPVSLKVPSGKMKIEICF